MNGQPFLNLESIITPTEGFDVLTSFQGPQNTLYLANPSGAIWWDRLRFYSCWHLIYPETLGHWDNEGKVLTCVLLFLLLL